MGSYVWVCPECGKTTDKSTTGSYDVADEIECPWCGRVSIVLDFEYQLSVRATSKKVSPTKLEELEKIKDNQRRRNESIRNKGSDEKWIEKK